MQRKSEYAIFLYTFFMVRSFGSNNYIPSNLFILFHPFSSKKAEKGRKRQKKVRYHGSISLLTCPAVFVRDPTIISDKNVEKGFREIMVAHSATIVGSFGSNHGFLTCPVKTRRNTSFLICPVGTGRDTSFLTCPKVPFCPYFLKDR